MLYGNEGRRYSNIENFRVDAVSEAYFLKANPLYRPRAPWAIDPGFEYAKSSLPKGKFATVEEALAACREALKPNGAPYYSNLAPKRKPIYVH